MAAAPSNHPNRVAVITGAASGIGLAAAKRFAGLGMKVCLADIDRRGAPARRRRAWQALPDSGRTFWPCRPT